MIRRVAFLPVYPNPYQHLLADGLAEEGIEVLKLAALPGLEWLRRERGRVQVLHLHWLSGLYMARWLTPVQMLRFVAWMLVAQRMGYGLVWTAHNILPHDLAGGSIWHVAMRRLVMARVHRVIVHCEAGRQKLLARFPCRKPISVIPIGSYANAFPLTTDRAAARDFLHLDKEQFVYLFLGNITPYKGLERFVDAFRRIAEPDDVAIIAGRGYDSGLVARLTEAAAGVARLRIAAREIPDEEMQYYLCAADVMVAPFGRILTSSSVMTGLSSGLPVVVPRLGCLPELVTPEMGIIYDPDDPGALGKALQEIKQRDVRQMGKVAKALVEQFSWATIARQTAEIYHASMESVA